MSSIRDSVVALDTNVFLFAVRRDASYPHCETLVFDLLPTLDVLVPGEVLRELRRNLNESLLAGVLEALRRARSVVFDHAPLSLDDIAGWEARGAKKGDAVIAACLTRAGVGLFVSENRHFLREIRGAPFQVVSSAEAVQLMKAGW